MSIALLGNKIAPETEQVDKGIAALTAEGSDQLRQAAYKRAKTEIWKRDFQLCMIIKQEHLSTHHITVHFNHLL